MVAAISRQNADKAPVPSFMLKDSPCFIGLKKNEPALKAKVDTLIEQGALRTAPSTVCLRSG